MREDHDRLADIIEAIERIERYSTGGRASFEADELVQSWMVHHIEILGEATRRLSDTLRTAHPEVPWQKMVAMRNVLAHGYFGIDLGLVWVTVQNDLPVLKGQIRAILEELGRPE